VKFPGTDNAGEELSHGGKSQRKRKPKMTSDNRARLRVAALIFVMVNAVVFGGVAHRPDDDAAVHSGPAHTLT